MVSRPDVSVLLPAFEAATTLGAALSSVRRSRRVAWECVVVDDGSRDATLEVARAAAAIDPRIEVLARPHEGIVAALNAGLAACRGAVVARLDADDWMHGDRLALQVAALAREPSWSAVGCHVRMFPRRDLSDGRRAYETWLASIDDARTVRREAFVECPVAHPTLAVRREVLERLGYRDSGWAEDYDLVLRLLGAGGEIGMVARPLVGWRDGPERLSRTDPRYAIERFTAAKAAFLAAGFLRDVSSYVLCGYGGTGKSIARALRRHGKELAHVVELHPRRIGKTIHGAPVIHPRDLRSIPRRPILASVAGLGPRTELRAELDGQGFVELEDYVCVA